MSLAQVAAMRHLADDAINLCDSSACLHPGRRLLEASTVPAVSVTLTMTLILSLSRGDHIA